MRKEKERMNINYIFIETHRVESYENIKATPLFYKENEA